MSRDVSRVFSAISWVIGAILVATVTACTHEGRPPSGNLFRFRIGFDPATLDWNLGDIPIAVIQNAMRGLYRVDASGKVVPDAAARGEANESGKKWVFTIRPDLVWSDGVRLNATHFVASIQRLLTPATGSSYAAFLYDIEGAEEFNRGRSKDPNSVAAKVLSDLSFEIRLKHPIAYLPALFTHWVTFPIRPDLLAKYPDYFTNPAHLATLGWYRIEEWKPQQKIVLTPNPYSPEKPWFQRVEGLIVSDDDSALNLFQTGHLEWMTDPGQNAAKNPDQLHKPSPIVYFLGVGPGHLLTTRRAGILALSAALDRTQIPVALNEPHRPTLDYCPPEVLAIINQAGDQAASYRTARIPLTGDPERARALLKEAGFSSPASVPPLTLRYFNRPAIKLLAEWLQGQWQKNLGITVSIEGQEPKTYWGELSRNVAPLFLNSAGASYPDPDAFFRLFTDRNPRNMGRWQTPEYDKIVEQASTSGSPQQRLVLYSRASQLLVEEQPGIIPLYFRDTEYLVKPFVKGLVINPLTSVYFYGAHY